MLYSHVYLPQCRVYVAQFVPPVVILSSIYQVTNHQPPVLSGHYKGATQEEVSLKERTTHKKAKRSCPMFTNRSTQFTGKLSVLPPWPIHTYPGKKKADNQIVGSGFLATGFSSEMASIKFLRFAPTSTIPLCRLPSWRRA